MQRLTKYPLLLENIIKHTEGRTWRGARTGRQQPSFQTLGLALTCFVTLTNSLASLVFRVFILFLLCLVSKKIMIINVP